MNQDRIENFIRKNRASWDDKKAPQKIWENIVTDLSTTQRNKTQYWKTLSFILATSLAILLAYLFFTSISGEHSRAIQPLMEYAEIPDFKETEQYYLSAIYTSHQELNKKHIDATLERDLSLLDINTEKLRIEYKYAQGPFKKQVLKAIILNHKTKLQILEKVLLSIDKNKNDIDDQAI